MNKMISKDFYEKLLSGKMGRLDIINAIEKITDSNLVKVKALKDDLEMYLGKSIYYPFMEHPLINLKEEPESDISQEEREKKLVTITWGNSEICKIRIPNSIGNKGIIFPAAGLSKPAPDFVKLEDDRYLQVCEVINSLKEKIKLAENPTAYENKMFCGDCEEIMRLNGERIEEFTEFSTPDETNESESKLSITDILKIEASNPNPIGKPKSELPEKLELLFEHISKYNEIMEILVSEKLIQPNTYIWIDEKKGNKALLVALIKDLHAKKYYKKNKRPTNEQIKKICRNSFGWEISIDTVKHAKATDFDLTFIPLA